MITILTYADDNNITNRIFDNETDARNTMVKEYNTALTKASDPDNSIIESDRALVLDLDIPSRWQLTRIPDMTFNKTSERLGEIKLKKGKLVVDKAQDPKYPGIDIEFIPYDMSDDDSLSRPRVLIEQPENENLRVLVWADSDSEDYSDNIEFENTAD